MLDVPPGMDLNTAGDGARTMKAKMNTGDGTVDKDYIVNLFTPDQPSRADGVVTTILTDPKIRQADLSAHYFESLLPPFTPVKEFDHSKRALVVSIIDSGVDQIGPSRNYWQAHAYGNKVETEFVKPGSLGADFIDKDLSPNDAVSHGTLVAGMVLGAYAADDPLQLVHFKVFGKENQASYFGALVSIYEASAIGSDVINMSWGIAQAKAPEALECAIDRAIGEGIYVVTSAGNGGTDLSATPQWPAAFAPAYPDQLLTVGAYWYRGRGLDGSNQPDPARDPHEVRLREFSNYGDPYVSVAAYMTAPVPGYQTAATVLPVGTSFSAPQITGQLASLIGQYPHSAVPVMQQSFRTANALSGYVWKDYYLPTPNWNGHRP
jgi:hypothetical protein